MCRVEPRELSKWTQRTKQVRSDGRNGWRTPLKTCVCRIRSVRRKLHFGISAKEAQCTIRLRIHKKIMFIWNDDNDNVGHAWTGVPFRPFFIRIRSQSNSNIIRTVSFHFISFFMYSEFLVDAWIRENRKRRGSNYGRTVIATISTNGDEGNRKYAFCMQNAEEEKVGAVHPDARRFRSIRFRCSTMLKERMPHAARTIND